VNGGAANDTLTDLSGTDINEGAGGTDTIDVRDGATGDSAIGGADVDTCRTDTGDKRSSCER
jgi:hypothetical protein